MSSWKSEYPFESRFLGLIGASKGSKTSAANTPAASAVALTSAIKMHFVDEGPKTSSQTIVCVHGNPTWSFYYRSIIRAFRADYRCLAIDHVGCGLSDKPQDYDYCLTNHVANFIEWLDRLDLRNVVLVVHDWGGAIGLGAAVARPHRIAKLLILNTAAFPPPYIPLRIAACRIPWLGSAAIRYLNAFAGTATWMAIDRLPRLSAAAKEGLLYPYRTPSDRIAIDQFVQDIPMVSTHRTYAVLEGLEQKLSSLANKPTRFVWGMKDWCFRPECLMRLQKAFPNASVRQLSDVGHYVMEEADVEVIEELLRLLES